MIRKDSDGDRERESLSRELDKLRSDHERIRVEGEVTRDRLEVTKLDLQQVTHDLESKIRECDALSFSLQSEVESHKKDISERDGTLEDFREKMKLKDEQDEKERRCLMEEMTNLKVRKWWYL